MREIGKIYGATIGCPQIVGTPEQVADQMEAIIDETGGDGFNITPSTMPGSLTEFVDGVVPILQKRGLTSSGVHGTDVQGAFATGGVRVRRGIDTTNPLLGVGGRPTVGRRTGWVPYPRETHPTATQHPSQEGTVNVLPI